MEEHIEILIVEDNKDDLYFIEKALSDKRFHYTVLSSGTEAYEYLQKPIKVPDIILIDYMLPGLNGLEILKKLGEEGLEYSFIFLTIDNSIDTVVQAMKLGALDFIVKSISLKQELPEKIDKVYTLHRNRIEKRKMERELLDAKAAAEENELMYHTLVDAVFDAIIVTQKGVILEVNSQAVEHSGYSYDELVGMNALELLVEGDKKHFEELDSHEWRNQEAHVKTASGDVRSVVINTRKASVNGTDVMISSIRDVSESRVLEEKLRQSEKMNAIGQLAGGIAHDFNNQLSPIIGYADMLSHQLDNPQYRKFAQNILHSAIRSADLTKKLLSFARKGQIILEQVNINEKISGVLDSLAGQISSSVKVVRDFGSPCQIIKGDPNQLEQTLKNLILNGIDAMPNGGTLSLSTACATIGEDHPLVVYNHLDEGTYLKISISDTGWGIPEDLKKNIFEPFFTTKEVGQGTGMGLASAYGAVKEHEGYISFSSEEGVGTEFIIYLPCDDGAGSFESERPEDRVETARKSRILIVDDEEMLRNMLEDILESDNHSIISCSSGEEALSFFAEEKNNIDLAILDMVMPGIDGFETFMKMKEIEPDVRVLISSGYNMKREFRKMREAGALGFLKKPYKINELRKQLKNILG